MYTDSPMVTSAPTGSGKTVIFELAIVRLLMQLGGQMASAKIIYGTAIKWVGWYNPTIPFHWLIVT